MKVVETIGKLKNGQDGKAPGICGISVEVIKAGDLVVVKWLHKIVSRGARGLKESSDNSTAQEGKQDSML